MSEDWYSGVAILITIILVELTQSYHVSSEIFNAAFHLRFTVLAWGGFTLLYNTEWVFSSPSWQLSIKRMMWSLWSTLVFFLCVLLKITQHYSQEHNSSHSVCWAFTVTLTPRWMPPDTWHVEAEVAVHDNNIVLMTTITFTLQCTYLLNSGGEWKNIVDCRLISSEWCILFHSDM